MSEPAENVAPETPPSLEEIPVERPRRAVGPALAAAVAVIGVLVFVAASPFWAPAIAPLLPWGAAAKPEPAAPDPALAATREQAQRNAAALQQLGQRIAALEAKPAPDISALQQSIAALQAKPTPDLSGIQQQLAALSKTTGDLTQSIAALDKAAQAQPAADPKNTALALVLLQIRDAVEIGRPFEAEYQALVALAHEHPEITAAAAPLAGPAQSGVASRAALIERLRQLAPQIATAKPAAKDSWKSQIVAQLRQLVVIRRIDGEAQSPAEAAVGAAQRDLAGGDLVGAVAALDALTGPAQAAAQPWLQTAKTRLAAEAALREVQAALVAALGNAALPGKG